LHPQPAIAVLTWRGYETTRACLESLRVLAQWPADIVVVDNDSGTSEGDRLAAETGVAGLTLDRNGGVAFGYNAAIRWAREHGHKQVLLLNNDTLLTDAATIDRLASLMADPSVAAAGPLIKGHDGEIASAGGRIGGLTGHAFRLRRPRGPAPYEVDWLDGSCLMVSVDAVCAIGGLSEDFFLYWEETDWCTRARARGFRCVVDPGTSITHAGGATASSRVTRRYALRNSLLFMRRNGTRRELALWLAGYVLIRVPVFLVRRLRQGAPLREAVADAVEAIGWNVRDTRSRGFRLPADGPAVCNQVVGPA
jgi:GT2 family glycosyltransferase